MSEPLVLDKMIWVVTDNPEKAQLIRTLLAYEDREILRSFKDLQFETLSNAVEARERLQHTQPRIIFQFAQLTGGPAVYYANREDYIPGGNAYDSIEAMYLVVISGPIESDRLIWGPGDCMHYFIEPIPIEQQVTMNDLMERDTSNLPANLHFQLIVHRILELPR